MADGVEINAQTGLRRVGVHRPFPTGPSTFAEIWTARDPASLAVIDGERVWRTNELRAEVDRVARSLAARGVRPHDRIAWILGNDVTSLISLLATVRADATWVGVSHRATGAERQELIDDAEPAAVFDALPDDDLDAALGADPPPNARAAIAYTSGTTGRPKGAVHTQQQLLYPAAAAIATEGLDSTARIGTPLPLSTLNIALLGPLTALACGGVAVMLRQTDGVGFAADVAEHRLTRALVVPTIVHDLVAAEVDPAQLGSLERLIMGGAGFDRQRAAAAQATLGIPLVASYGLSEAPTGVARMVVGDHGARPLPGIDVRIEDDGEITLAATDSGPWARCWQGALGYWRRPDLTTRLWRGGRLHTDDAGTLDDDGRLLVTGRVGDMINRGGATIAPAEVEAVLLAVPEVTDAAVFGIAHERLGQVVAAAVVGDVDLDTLRTTVRASLSGYKVPERWIGLPRLPRNANGKVDREALRSGLG
ncbi:MAG: AMP-binding protein [Actinomycetota bacterium]